MYSQTTAAGTARATIDCFAERPVVRKPLVDELVELPVLSQKKLRCKPGQYSVKRVKYMLICVSS
jgi:hypothetical protein